MKAFFSSFFSNPLYIATAVVVLIAAISGYFVYRSHENSRHEQVLVNLGAAQEKEQSNAQTINAVELGKAATEHPSTGQLNIVCSKYDRNCSHGS